MIISHKHKFIYIRTRKTASSSMEILLSSICGPDDVITPVSEEETKVRTELGCVQTQNCDIPPSKWTQIDWVNYQTNKLVPQYKRHMTCQEVQDYVDMEIWNGYFKFAFDRNPYDKIVSFYYWREGNLKYKSVAEFLKSGILRTIDSYDMYAIDKIVAVDALYQYEKLAEALLDLSKKLGLDYILKMPEYRAKSGHRLMQNHQELLDEESKQIIRVVFAREIALFGYEE